MKSNMTIQSPPNPESVTNIPRVRYINLLKINIDVYKSVSLVLYFVFSYIYPKEYLKYSSFKVFLVLERMYKDIHGRTTWIKNKQKIPMSAPRTSPLEFSSKLSMFNIPVI